MKILAVILVGLCLCGCRTAPQKSEVPPPLFTEWRSFHAEPEAHSIQERIAAGIQTVLPPETAHAVFLLAPSEFKRDGRAICASGELRIALEEPLFFPAEGEYREIPFDAVLVATCQWEGEVNGTLLAVTATGERVQYQFPADHKSFLLKRSPLSWRELEELGQGKNRLIVRGPVELRK